MKRLHCWWNGSFICREWLFSGGHWWEIVYTPMPSDATILEVAP